MVRNAVLLMPVEERMTDSVVHQYLPWVLAGLAGVVVAALVGYVRARLSGRRRVPARRRPAALGRFRGKQAQPGYVWFAAIPFDEGGGAKDRPCLVVRTHPRGALVLKVTSQDKRGRAEYTRMAVHTWDPTADRDSFLELYPLREVPYAAFRRPAGPCEHTLWTKVARLHRADDR